MTITTISPGINLRKLKRADDFKTIRWNSTASLLLAHTAKTSKDGATFRRTDYSESPTTLKFRPYNSNATATIKIENDDSFDKWNPGTKHAFANLKSCNPIHITALLNEVNSYRTGIQLPELENLEDLPNDFTGKRIIISSETEDGKPFDFKYSLSENNGEIIVDKKEIGLQFRTLELFEQDKKYEDLRRFGLMGLATLLPGTLARFATPFDDDLALKAKYGPAIEN